MANYTTEGNKTSRANVEYYKPTARLIKTQLEEAGLSVYGGENAPYIWCRAPYGWDSWRFFDFLLQQCQVVSTPGVGFGSAGEGFVRFSAFSAREDCIEALARIKKTLISNRI